MARRGIQGLGAIVPSSVVPNIAHGRATFPGYPGGLADIDPLPGSDEAWERGKKTLVFWGIIGGVMLAGFAYVVAKEGLTT